MKHLAIAAAALAMMAGPAAAQETTLRLSSWLPPSHPIVADMIVPWIEDVEAATDGRVQVQILDAPLGPPPAHFDLAQTGAADLTFGVHGYTPGRFTLTQLGELPFLTPSATAASVAHQRVHEAMFAEAGEHAGTKLIGTFLHGPGMLWLQGRDLDDPEAVEGAKIRVVGRVSNDLTTGMGMVPLQAPATQAYEILAGGVADGIVFPPESIIFFRLDEIVETGLTVEGGLYNTSFFFVMNQGAYDGLSDEDRAAIDALSGEAFARRAGGVWDAVDAAGMEAMAGRIEAVAASAPMQAKVEAAAAPIYEAIRGDIEGKGVDFDAALEMFRAEVEAVSAE
jgi:TRAP-type C4-dicarboxylate transport system substrate-binding protein